MITSNRIKIMNANSQVQRGCVECAGGILNYKNDKDGPPFAAIEFNDGGDEEAGEENIKVATANIAVNEVIPVNVLNVQQRCILVLSSMIAKMMTRVRRI
jgi:hypothetical protein